MMCCVCLVYDWTEDDDASKQPFNIIMNVRKTKTIYCLIRRVTLILVYMIYTKCPLIEGTAPSGFC